MASEVTPTTPETLVEGESRTPRRRRSNFSIRRSLFGRRSTLRPQVSKFRDHFSLQSPTSFVRFHDSKSAARVILNEESQLIIEEIRDKETKQRNFILKQIPEETGGSLTALRLTYTLVAAFFVAFLLVFEFQTLYFVALDFIINLNQDDKDGNADIYFAIAVILSLPTFVKGFSYLMMIAMIFVKDLWNGHALFRKFVFPNLADEAVEWAFVLVLLVFPLFVLGGCLLSGTEIWFEFTALYWLFSVLVAFLTFVVNVLWYEARTYVEVVAGLESMMSFDSFWQALRACLVLRKRHSLSGYSTTTYMSFGTPDTAELTGESRKYVIDGTLKENRRGLYSRITQIPFLHGILFKPLDEPQRLYSVDDLTGQRPYVTAYSWGLENYFCRPRKSRYIGIVKGPGAVTRKQLKSTIGCAAVGLFLMYFLLFSVMEFMGLNRVLIAVIMILAIFSGSYYFRGPLRRAKELAKLAILKQDHKRRVGPSTVQEETDKGPQEENGHESADEEANVRSSSDNNDVLLSSNGEGGVREGEATTGPIEKASNRNHSTPELNGKVVSFAEGIDSPQKRGDDLHVFAETEDGLDHMTFAGGDDEASFGLYAVSELYRISEPTDAFCILYVFVSIVLSWIFPVSALYYMESWQLATIYLVICTLVFVRHYTNSEVLIQEKGGLLAADNDSTSNATRWLSQNRLSNAAGKIRRGKSFRFWRFVFGVSTVVLLFFGYQAIGSSTKSIDDYALNVTKDFYYQPQNSLHYASCDMYRNLNGNLATTMADYMYMAAQSYRVDSLTEADLAQWYGEGVVVDRSDIVQKFRESRNDRIPVFYRMFTAEIDGRLHAAVAVRGTQSTWDLFADGQLYGAAAMLQMVRAILPFGWMWNPILDELVNMLSSIQTGTIRRKSFFKSTTAFVKHLQASGNYTSVVILGHSLGGGIATITGAQAGVQAVAVSGPNAMISRQRFNVTAENLERYTFNIIPDGDPVAMVDDPTKNLQRIECHADQTDFLSCHSIIRSICEAQTVCGSGSRPVLCDCANIFGYPEPTPKPNTTISFRDACGAPVDT